MDIFTQHHPSSNQQLDSISTYFNKAFNILPILTIRTPENSDLTDRSICLPPGTPWSPEASPGSVSAPFFPAGINFNRELSTAKGRWKRSHRVIEVSHSCRWRHFEFETEFTSTKLILYTWAYLGQATEKSESWDPRAENRNFEKLKTKSKYIQIRCSQPCPLVRYLLLPPGWKQLLVACRQLPWR